MKFYLPIAAFILFNPSVYSQPIQPPIQGSWLGTLSVAQLKLRLVLHVKTVSNVLVAALDSPDQGAKGIVADEVSYKNDSLFVMIKSIGVRYRGMYVKDSSAIKGIFEQRGAKFPLIFKNIESEKVLRRPQEPQSPYPYKAEPVTFKNAAAKITLSGTLTYPSTGSTFPAVILISGSGPQDRDGFILGHKPFLVLADYLTRSGIAVLRFDDRGVAKSNGDFASATSEDFATDVEAAIAYLLTRTEIKAGKIGLIGHSEGGIIAPLVAAKNKNVAFVVLMAGPGITGKEILATQTTAMLKQIGATDAEVSAISESTDKAQLFASQESDAEKQKAECNRLIQQYFSNTTAARKTELGISVDNYMIRINAMKSPWMKYFLNYDPAYALQKIKIPVLALNGSKDLQVLADTNLQAIENALKKGKNKKYEVVKLEELNHLFQKAQTGMPAEYSLIEETLNQQLLTRVTDWILKISSRQN